MTLIISYKQGTISQGCVLVIDSMIDYDSADFAFGCGYFAFFTNRYFPKFRRFRTNLAEVTLIISYKQGTISQGCVLVIDSMIDYDSADLSVVARNSRCLCLAHSHNTSKSQCS